MFDTAIADDEFELIVDNTTSPKDSYVSALGKVGVSPQHALGDEEDIRAFFASGEGVDRLAGKLIDLPPGMSSQKVMKHVARLEPKGSWSCANPRQLAAYIVQKGVKDKQHGSRPIFYILSLSTYPFVFTNADLDAVESYLQYGPVIRGENDYYWRKPMKPEHHDRELKYLVVRKV